MLSNFVQDNTNGKTTRQNQTIGSHRF
uniref:Uncharacterized protein n=1 Tax=Rhizophora mucronata TaxID=61149 RepID=A0A2P2NX22_RHIMU